MSNTSEPLLITTNQSTAMNTHSHALHHHHHHEAGHSCTVPDPSPDRAAELGRLRFLATKVAMVHGQAQPAMVALAAIVNRVAEAPQQPISSEERSALARATTNYSPWPNACGSVRALFDGLKQLPDHPV